MLLSYKNNNTLTSYPSSLGVYQQEYENWDLYQEINIFGLEPKPENAELVVHTTPEIINTWVI